MLKKSPLLPLVFTVLLDMIGIGIIIPVLAPLMYDPTNSILPAETSDALRGILLGFLVAAFSFMQFFGAPVLGTLSDSHGRKKILLISLFGTLIGYILFAVGIIYQNIYILFLSRFIDGFTGGNISIAHSAIADVSDAKSKAKNFGLIGMAFGFGFVIGPFIGGKLADPEIISWFNFATPFYFAAMLTFVNIMLVALLLPETLSERVRTKVSFLTGFRNLKKALGMTNMRTIFTVMFLMAFGFNFFTQFFQVYMIEKFGFDQSQIGNLFAFIGVWIIITQALIVRVLAKKYSAPQVLKFSLALFPIVMISLLIPDKALYLYMLMPLIAVSNGLSYPNITATISNLADKKVQGEILGVNQSIQSLAQIIPPIIAGFIVSINKSLPIMVAAACLFMAWLVFFINRKTFNKVS